jgi:uncharacterized integral membrane protein (TIGR00697 family)
MVYEVLYNSALWFGFLILNLIVVVVVYRYFGKAGLYMVIVASVITANIQVLKTVRLFGLVSTLGNVIYGCVFLATDILSEVYGKKSAQRGVWLGFAGMVLVTVWMQISLIFIPDASDFAQESLETIFGIMPRIMAGSILAYLLSQHHDVLAFHYWKNKTEGRFLWLRNNASTMVSQIIDTVAFSLVALWGVFEIDVWWQILLTTYLMKWIVAVVDTPFIYLAKRLSKSVLKKELALLVVE